MRRTKEAANITREEVLRAASHVFRARGYGEATLDEVAKRAGVTRGAVYWHFPKGKPDLWVEWSRKTFSELKKQVEGRFKNNSVDVISNVGLVLTDMADVFEQNVFVDMFRTLGVLRSENDPELQEVLDIQQTALDWVLAQVKDCLGKAKKAGEIRRDVDPETAAAGVLALGLGLGSIGQQMGEERSKGRGVIDMFLMGLG